MAGVITTAQSFKGGLIPDSYDKHGPAFTREKVYTHYLGRIKVGTFFRQVEKDMVSEVEKAVESVEKVTERFVKSVDAMGRRSDDAVATAKNASAKVRDASEKLSVGLQRIEKLANFDRLERYVELLERAYIAIDALARLEGAGKLEKIAAAIR